jgi:tetratricopeptide (TPR) repeat protein
MVFGGFVLFMGLLLSVLQMLSPDSPTPGPNSVTTKSNEEVVANLLSEGRALLDKGDATAALGYFERALIIKPDDPQALELKMKAQEQRRKVPAAGGPGSQR